MSEGEHTDAALQGWCSWAGDTGYKAWTKYGEIAVFENGGQRAVELMLMSAAACLNFFLVEYAKGRNLPILRIEVTCDGTVAHRPDRLGSIETKVLLDGPISNAQRKKMLTACERACKVMNTLKILPTVEAVLISPDGNRIE